MTHVRSFTRRQALGYGGAAVTAVAVGVGVAPANAQSGRVAMDQLLKEGALEDIWIGRPDAPVTIVEYASMTCAHCAAFHQGTFQELKAQYIDTGKVRMTTREFPFDPLATGAFMLARCEGPDKRGAMIELLFARQQDWAANPKPFEALVSLTRQAGMSQERFESCLKDKELYDKIASVRDHAAQAFNVRSTPTFFINGVLLTGNRPLADFARIIDPLVNK